mmetsp:Transcript_2980/g.2458  ORF Transcript_2980/g.2458 Transcript_2980/m.2458 type:complete len:87 (+) Transcript_2980:14-274(+)
MNFIQVEHHYNKISKMEKTMKRIFTPRQRITHFTKKQDFLTQTNKLRVQNKSQTKLSKRPHKDVNLRYLLSAVAKVKKDQNIFDRK